MQAPCLAQPEKWASPHRDRAIWIDGCTNVPRGVFYVSSLALPSVQIARARTRDLIRASLSIAATKLLGCAVGLRFL